MRIAVISDVHGNLAALEAVLTDIACLGADLTVNLGDLVSGPLQPRDTASRLMGLNLPTIRGNHERQLLSGDGATMGDSDRFARDQLTAEQLAWIESLPTKLTLAAGVLLCHGTPDDDLAYLMETVEETGKRAATDDEICERLNGATAEVILCGHTHTPRARLIDGMLVLNPGSVGLQAYSWNVPRPHVMQTGAPSARYALVERGPRGWHHRFRTVEYDHVLASQEAASRGAQEWAIALETGTLPSSASVRTSTSNLAKVLLT